MTKQQILGNQKEKKPIEELLRQAGKDTVIDGVVKKVLRQDNKTGAEGNATEEQETLDKKISFKFCGRIAHPRGTRAVSLSSDGKYLATGCDDCHIRLFKLDDVCHGLLHQADSENIAKKHIPHVVVNSVSFDPSGKYLAVAGSAYVKIFKLKRDFKFFNFRLKHITSERHLKAYSMNSVAFHPTKGYLATGCNDGYTRVYNFKKGKLEEIANLKHPGHVSAVDPYFYFLTAGIGRHVTTFEFESEFSKISDDEAPVTVFGLSHTPDSRFLAAGHCGYVGIYHTTFLKESGRIQHPDTVCEVDFSSDGKFLATACLDGNVRLYQVNREE